MADDPRELERLRTELDEFKARLDAADEAFIDMAQTRGGLDRADALMHVTRIMSTLRGHETPHRVAYERVRAEARAELERLRKGVDDAAWHLNDQRQRAEKAEAEARALAHTAKLAAAERDEYKATIERVRALHAQGVMPDMCKECNHVPAADCPTLCALDTPQTFPDAAVAPTAKVTATGGSRKSREEGAVDVRARQNYPRGRREARQPSTPDARRGYLRGAGAHGQPQHTQG